MARDLENIAERSPSELASCKHSPEYKLHHVLLKSASHNFTGHLQKEAIVQCGVPSRQPQLQRGLFFFRARLLINKLDFTNSVRRTIGILSIRSVQRRPLVSDTVVLMTSVPGPILFISSDNLS